MIAKFKFYALSHRGKKVTFTRSYRCPYFEVIPASSFNGLSLPPISVESQLMDWMDQHDKSLLMVQMDVDIILDYEVYKPKKRVSLADLIKSLDLDPQIVIDMGAIYKEIKSSLKGKSNEAKLQTLLSHLHIAYGAQVAAYKDITNTLRRPKPEKQTLSYEDVKRVMFPSYQKEPNP